MNDSLLKNSHQKYLEEKSSRPNNLAYLVSRKRTIIEFSILILSALLYATAFPPLNFSSYAWIALLPLILLTQNSTAKNAFIRGYIWGYAWAFSAFFWLREIEIFIPPLIALVLALFPATWATFIPILKKYTYFPAETILEGSDAINSYLEENKDSLHWNILDIFFSIYLASIWVFLEWVRSWFLTGLPWNYLSTTQWQNPVIIQISDITGAYGVSFLIALFNASLATAIPKFLSIIKTGKFKRPFALYFSIILIMLAIAYGTRKLLHPNLYQDQNIKIAVIQGNIPQCRIPTEEQAWYALNKYLELTEMALQSNPDLVIWPETAVPLPYRSTHPVSVKYRKEIARLASEFNTYFLIGSIDYGDVPFDKRNPEEIPVHNSALLIAPDGNIVQKYHKVHLVPFGEYTPFGKYFEKLKKIFGMGRDLTPGKDYTIFNLPNGFTAGVNICFEDIFPHISRNFVRKNADFIIVLTNDAWYPTSSEPEQHFSHSVFRAIENRRPVLRSGNNNFSSITSHKGIVTDSITTILNPQTQTRIPHPSVKTHGFAIFQLHKMKNPHITFYTKYGDIFIFFCFLISSAAFCNAFFKWKQIQTSISESFKTDEQKQE